MNKICWIPMPIRVDHVNLEKLREAIEVIEAIPADRLMGVNWINGFITPVDALMGHWDCSTARAGKMLADDTGWVYGHVVDIYSTYIHTNGFSPTDARDGVALHLRDILTSIEAMIEVGDWTPE